MIRCDGRRGLTSYGAGSMSRSRQRRGGIMVGRPLAAAALGVAAALLPVIAPAQSRPNEKLAERAHRAGEIIAELVQEPDHAPPESLLDRAACVAAVPKAGQAGVGFGGARARAVRGLLTTGGNGGPALVRPFLTSLQLHVGPPKP